MKKILHRIPALLLLLFLLIFSLSSCSGKAEVDTTIKPIPASTDVHASKVSITPATVPSELQVETSTQITEQNPGIGRAGRQNSESEILPVEKKANDSKSKRKSHMIAIDAGHQSKANNKKEPIGPGSTVTKPKVSSGTKGIATGVPEYKLNLAIALQVKEELIIRGYEVYMIREKNEVNLSNRERAELANESGADLFIRIHADGCDNREVNGTSTLYPSEDNPYVAELSDESYTLSKAIVDAMCERTGAKNRGAIARDDMSGINWCAIPVSIIEMGYMSNKKEDKLMQTKEYQDKIVIGICDGIDDYFD